MYISDQRSTFNYLGGKYSILPWLLPILKTAGHTHFVDVMGGSAVVLVNMPPSPIETYNDINGDIVNFFRVLRSNHEELIDKLHLTPYSRNEYESAWFLENESEVERARKFFIRTQQSIWAAGAHDQVKGWAISTRESRCNISEKTHKWLKSVKGLNELVNRLKLVQIESRDFRYVLKNYDSPETLFYVDPPYDKLHRSSTEYKFDFENQDFYDLQYWCLKASGKVAVSGYDTPFMRSLFAEFKQHIGPKRKNNRSKKEAFESVWTNF